MKMTGFQSTDHNPYLMRRLLRLCSGFGNPDLRIHSQWWEAILFHSVSELQPAHSTGEEVHRSDVIFWLLCAAVSA